MVVTTPKLLLCAALVLVYLPACKLTIYGPGLTDGPGRDTAPTADSGVDAPGVPDLPRPDLPPPDLPPPDMPLPDLPLPDLQQPDTSAPDLTPPDFGTIAGVWLRVNKRVQTTSGHATIKPGKAVTLDGVVSCPAVFGCKYSWDLGNGTTSTAKSPGSVTYTKVGVHHVTFTVRDKKNTVLGKARADVVVWTGKYTDNFTRTDVPPTIQHDKYLWLKPLDAKAIFSIKSNRLHVTHNLGLPGSGALRSAPAVRDVRVQVTVQRSQITTVAHYSDVILRMHPQKLNGAFYRVRLKEGVAAYGHEIDLTIFKIVTSADEHGISLTAKPPVLTNYDPSRKKHMRLTIDIKDNASGVPVFNVTVATEAAPTKVLLQIKDLKDTTKAPHTHAGFTGLTQFKGQTYFDDFVVQELAP